MKEVQIVSLSQDDTFTEKLSLEFRTFEMGFTETSGSTASAGFDLKSDKTT
jgi:hypothetical protein